MLLEIARLAGDVSRSGAVMETKSAARKNQFRQARQSVHPLQSLSSKYFSFVFPEFDVNSVRPAAHEGRFATVTTRWQRDAMAALLPQHACVRTNGKVRT
jgi:hypothetical protein